MALITDRRTLSQLQSELRVSAVLAELKAYFPTLAPEVEQSSYQDLARAHGSDQEQLVALFLKRCAGAYTDSDADTAHLALMLALCMCPTARALLAARGVQLSQLHVDVRVER